ncbi:MAG: electron transport complex subunit RsxG [Nevskiales bacterium]
MAAPETLRQMLISAGILAGFAVAGSLLLGLTESGTRDQIVENERNYLISSLNQVLAPEHYDNDLLTETHTVQAPEALGIEQPVTVYVAKKDEQTVAALFTIVAPDGYSGDIRLLIGVNADGSLAGVRAVSHRETPGLGDAIEVTRSQWITGFAGLGIGKPPEEQWRVKKDGGQFDQFTGATITPRAVVKAVKKALLYFQANKSEFLLTAGVEAEAATASPTPVVKRKKLLRPSKDAEPHANKMRH